MKIWGRGGSCGGMRAGNWCTVSSSLLRTLESPSMPGLSACVEDSILYMKEHFSEHFSIEELAGLKGLSSAYFTRLFTRETGQAPLSYLTDLRLTHALSLLLNTSLSVEAIARACGFPAEIISARYSEGIRLFTGGIQETVAGRTDFVAIHSLPDAPSLPLPTVVPLCRAGLQGSLTGATLPFG